MTTQKKIVTVPIDRHTISPSELEGKVTSIIEILSCLVAEYGDTVSIDYGQHQQYDDYYSYQVRIDREETDTELFARELIEKEQSDKRFARDKAEFERLSKIFMSGEQNG